jgi:glutathione reductase (NADPH)
VATTLMYRGPLFLRGFDSGVRRFVADELRKKDIDLRFDADIARIERDDATGVLTVTLVDGSTVETDLVLCATGRAPNVEGLGLEAVGVRQRPNGAIEVDAHYRTSVPNILAIGDVTDRLQLTPVAIAEGMCVAKTLFGGQPSTLDYTNVATAVFCQPNIGTVGITEDEAIASGRAIRVFETSFRPMKHTLSGRDERTFMKLVVDAVDDRVLGAHMVGDAAGEIIQGLAIALKAGVTKAVFDATVGIHPTAAEEFVTMREPRA